MYGPFEEPGRFIPTLIMKGLEGTLPPLVSADVARDFIYVDDFVEACVLCAKKTHEWGAVYNCGTEQQITIREAVEISQRLFGMKEKPQYGSMGNRSWDTHIWVSNSQKIQSVLGWRPQHTFAQGFAKTVKWFQDNPQFMEIYKSNLAAV